MATGLTKDFRVLVTILGYKGYAVIRRYRYYSPVNARRVIWPCEPFADVHLVTSRTPIGSHAVIWLKDGTILDPAKESPCRICDYTDVESVAGIFKVSDGSDTGPLQYLHWSNGTPTCIWCGAGTDKYSYQDLCPVRQKRELERL